MPHAQKNLGDRIGTTSQVALAAGLGSRFTYWRGQSGARYLFSHIPAMDLEAYSQSIVLLTDTRSGDQPVWVGEVDSNGRLSGPNAPRAIAPHFQVHVHFLAQTSSQRRTVLDDLSPRLM